MAVGARIIEIERHLQSKHGDERVDIEIWDCSGDQNYER
jgi:hypothetical protein